MVFKLMLLRAQSSTPYLLLSPPLSLPHLLLRPSFFSSTATTAAAAASTAPLSLTSIQALAATHGPSLRKGKPLSQNSLLPLNSTVQTSGSLRISPNDGDEDGDILFDEEQFTRVFEVAALRVPSERCYALESRLRGHLLNWPRIHNIARVPGDEIDKDVLNLLSLGNGAGGDEEVLRALNRRIYGKAEGDGDELSPVLYRDKLAKEFNSRGFVKFRNLAKISRPVRKRRKKKGGKESEDEGEKESRTARREAMEVEVMQDEDNDGDEGEERDLSGLLGDAFKGQWRCSTRLLLLDEKYATKQVDDLPEAVKAAFREDTKQDTELTFELVRCKLKLFYDYWSMSEILEALLAEDMIVPTAFETVGHIAHLNLLEEHLPYKKIIAKVVLDKNRPKIQTVVNKVDAISNVYRTMQLEVLAGNHSLVTTVVENGLRFQVDLATVYWNSRLATERQRLVSCFKHDDVVCDVYSGVGPIAITAAKKVKHVYANDLNPFAVDYLERNCVLNRLERKIEVCNMDGRRFIDAIFSNEKTYPITQVVMNLPHSAAEHLDVFRGIFRNKPKDETSTLPTIHVYGFSKAEDPEFEFHERIRIGISEVAVAVEMRRVRLVAPGKWMLCASFVLPESVAYGRSAHKL